MSELADAYRGLRDAGDTHADALDALIRRYGLDRPTVRGRLEVEGVLGDHRTEAPPAPSRTVELQARKPKAKDRRRADRERQREARTGGARLRRRLEQEDDTNPKRRRRAA